MRITACERGSFRARQLMNGELVRRWAETCACVRLRGVRGPGRGNAAKMPISIPQTLAAGSSQSSRAMADLALRKALNSPPAGLTRKSRNRHRALRPDCGLERPRSAKQRQIQSPLLMPWRPKRGCRDGRARTTISPAAPARAAPSESPGASSIETSASLGAYPRPSRYQAASAPSRDSITSLQRGAGVKSIMATMTGSCTANALSEACARTRVICPTNSCSALAKKIFRLIIPASQPALSPHPEERRGTRRVSKD